MNSKLATLILMYLLFIIAGCRNGSTHPETINSAVVRKSIILQGNQRFQTIDGFGVNITPAQWRGGNLKPVIDSIVNGLGATLIRFDCYGKADWLDPTKANPDGSFPAPYLEKVYSSKIFKDAWAAFRYLNSKGIEPVFNISGAVPAAWTTAYNNKHDRLNNFNAYASMAASLLLWAREKEGLKFSYFMPFNETDLGFPEGARVTDEDCVTAINAVLKKLAENKLSDIRCIVMDDANIHLDRIKTIADHLSSPDKIKGIGVHTYGNGGDEDGRNGWLGSESQFAAAKNIIQNSAFKDKSFLLTEYGDLDQSGEIEFEIGWRSTRRLLKCLNDGMTGGIAWDAFDNFHEHDTAWAKYGLFETDTVNWKYHPKERYFAAKQVYKYVKPGFQRIAIESPDGNPNYIYKEWKRSLRNMLLSAFIAPDGKNFTLTGMNSVETDVELSIELKEFDAHVNDMPVHYYRTSSKEHALEINGTAVKGDTIKVIVPAHSLFTITSLP